MQACSFTKSSDDSEADIANQGHLLDISQKMVQFLAMQDILYSKASIAVVKPTHPPFNGFFMFFPWR